MHYTGARVEEIAGLPAAAVLPEGNAWGLDIRPHEERRLKNFQSERLLPIHDQLIELGLIEQRDRMLASKQEYLFPGLRPNNPKYPFHKAMRYNWNEARKMQLGDAAEGLTLDYRFRMAFASYLLATERRCRGEITENSSSITAEVTRSRYWRNGRKYYSVLILSYRWWRILKSQNYFSEPATLARIPVVTFTFAIRLFHYFTNPKSKSYRF